MRRMMAVMVAVTAVVVLAGCGEPSGDSKTDGANPSGVYSRRVKTLNGRTVDCILYGDGSTYGKAITCDWGHSE